MAQFTVPFAARPVSGVVVPTHVAGQSCGNTSGGSNVATITCTFPSPITAGNFIWVTVWTYTGNLISATMSGDSDTFTARITNVSAGNNNASAWSVASATGGGTTLTVTIPTPTCSSGTCLTIMADEYTGVGVLDVAGTVNGPSTLTGGPLTTTANGDLVLGVFYNTAGDPINLTGGISPGASTSVPSRHSYIVQTTAGTISAVATSTYAPAAIAYEFAFKHQ